MSNIIHRDPQSIPRMAVSGRGVEITDSSGNVYLDACGGAAVSSLGHGHPDVIAAIHAQIDQLAYAHTGFFTTSVAEQLAEVLASKAPGTLNHAYFVSGGSEAVEAALKLARQYYIERGQSERTLFIARQQSYHGNTLGALAVGGNEWRRRPYSPMLMDCAHISPCYQYRGQLDGETEEEYTDRLLGEFEARVLDIGPRRILGFIAETVGGATVGAIPPTKGYFAGIRALCDEYDILWIADEIMCGMGRTGSLFAFEQEGVIPDIVTVAKGLGGGYQPIGAFLAQSKIIETIEHGGGAFQHGHTYLGHPVAAAAALAVQIVIERDKLIDQVQARGAHLSKLLHEHFDEHPHVGDIRGRGLFMAIEVVADRATKTPFDPSHKVHAAIKANAMSLGLMVYPMGGTADGRSGDHVLLAPPFISTEANLEEMVSRLSLALGISIP